MNIQSDISLSDIVYYHIGGIAHTVIDVASIDDIREALIYCRQQALSPIRILGLGCNTLLPDVKIEGAVIHMLSDPQSLAISDTTIIAFAGTVLDDVIQYTFTNNLSGLTWAGGLPSTVGGAVRGNAGCFGSEMKDIVKSVDYIDMDDASLTVQTFTNAECAFSYRNSLFKQHPNLLIISVTLQLRKANGEEMQKEKAIYAQNISYRQSHHPLEYPSCGSVFKNIVGQDKVEKIIAVWPDIRELATTKWYGKISMAYVIGRLGFAGLRVGGAQISQKHNNYISNIDHARASDVKAIITEVSKKFTQTFGFPPELEVEIVSY